MNEILMLEMPTRTQIYWGKVQSDETRACDGANMKFKDQATMMSKIDRYWSGSPTTYHNAVRPSFDITSNGSWDCLDVHGLPRALKARASKTWEWHTFDEETTIGAKWTVWPRVQLKCVERRVAVVCKYTQQHPTMEAPIFARLNTEHIILGIGSKM